MQSSKKALCLSLSVIALAAPAMAMAQQAEESGIADIVVTAQKRSTSLQKTAAAVTALSDVTLKQSGIKDLAQVQTIVPAARFHQESNTTQVFLRGVGSNLDFANVETTVRSISTAPSFRAKARASGFTIWKASKFCRGRRAHSMDAARWAASSTSSSSVRPMIWRQPANWKSAITASSTER